MITFEGVDSFCFIQKKKGELGLLTKVLAYSSNSFWKLKANPLNLEPCDDRI